MPGSFVNSAMHGSTNQSETPGRQNAQRLALIAYVGITLLAFLPALATPFFLDDHLHAAMVKGTFPVARSPIDLYDFVADDDRAAMLDRGFLPWWTHPQLTIRFFRPLSSVLLYADHRLFGDNAGAMHLHSLAWWVAAVLGARALFRRWFSPRVALIASIVFAVSPCHAMPLGWLANREALLSLAFGTFALGAFSRWRDGGAVKHALLAALFFALALLGGGEYALCFGGYVLAIDRARAAELRESLGRRLLGLVPFAVPAAAYLWVRAHLGYGTLGSGFYSDPLHDPVMFLSKAPWRATALVANGWLTLDAAYVNAWEKWSVFAAVVLIGVLGWVAIKRTFARLPTAERRTARWLLLGSFLAMAPVLAVVPSLRLMGVAMIGIAPVVAIVVDQAWFPGKPEETTRDAHAMRLFAIAVGFAHFVHGPITGFLNASSLRKDAAAFGDRVVWLREHAGGEDPTQAHIGVIRGTAPVFFAPFGIDRHGVGHWYVLAQTGHVLVLRKDERTFELVVAEDRSVYPAGDGNLYRSEDTPLRTGDIVHAAGMTATILAVGERGPRRVRITLDEDAGTLFWLNDASEQPKVAELPAPGFGAPFDP
jgi:hypothetical protein